MTEIPVSKVKYESVNNEEDPSVIWDDEAKNGEWLYVRQKMVTKQF